VAIDPIAAACDAIAAHLTTISGLTAQRGWPEHGVEASIASGAGLLAVAPGPAKYERCSPRAVDTAVSAPNVLVTYRIAWLRIEAQLDLWAPYRATRDDLVALVEAKARHLKGDLGALAEMAAHMRTLIDFYPKHIEAEDQDFFVPVMDYFTEAEQRAMLLEFHGFDRRMIHEKYDKVVRRFEVERNLPGAKKNPDWIKTL